VIVRFAVAPRIAAPPPLALRAPGAFLTIDNCHFVPMMRPKVERTEGLAKFGLAFFANRSQFDTGGIDALDANGGDRPRLKNKLEK
jgi:hypothetical protein